MLSVDNLHSYQKYAVDFMLENESSFLVLDMGLGKTVSTLTAIQLLQEQQKVGLTLVVAPKRVAEHTWPAEIANWEHLQGISYSVVAGTVKQREKALQQEAQIYIIGRDNVKWLVDKYSKVWPFDHVVIDESSSFKNARSIRFKSLRKIRQQIDRIVLLTGTPAPNSLLELFPQAYLLDQGKRLGKSLYNYRMTYFTPSYNGYDWEPRRGAASHITQKLADITISMKASDYLELPEYQPVTHWVAMSTATQRAYAEFAREFVLDCIPNGEVTAANAAVLSGKLLQMANGAVYDSAEEGAYHVLHDEKLEALDEILEAAQGEQVLVAYQYRHDKERLMKRHPSAIDVKDKGAMDLWNSRQLPGQIMLCHPQSAGHGLNLQHGGRRLVWFGMSWSLELYQQTNARLHRQGQKDTVFVHHIACSGTLDERVLNVLGEREIAQDAIVDAVKAIIKAVR